MRVNGNPKIWAKFLLISVAVVTLAPAAIAQITPPYWNNGHPQVANGVADSAIKPAPWPSEAQWAPYSWGTTYPDTAAPSADRHPIRDPRVQDPSNGGTSPQNYVNVSSGCGDKTLPSIYYFYDKTADGGN